MRRLKRRRRSARNEVGVPYRSLLLLRASTDARITVHLSLFSSGDCATALMYRDAHSRSALSLWVRPGRKAYPQSFARSFSVLITYIPTCALAWRGTY